VPDRERGGTTYYVVSHEPQPSYGTVGGSQPAGGQFPGQQSGGVGSFGGQRGNGAGAGKKSVAGPVEAGEGEGSQGAPPTYADVIKGDNKVQGP